MNLKLDLCIEQFSKGKMDVPKMKFREKSPLLVNSNRYPKFCHFHLSNLT